MKFFRWIYRCFTAECNDGACWMWDNASLEEREELLRYWKTHP